MFIQQIFTKHILCAKHCDKGTMVTNTAMDCDLMRYVITNC